ncbi:YfhO family protein [Adlercreutzia sp. ZJ138]|uniref:YfhO family protein n=1 Tax=Adlercreutzia sp. ZJ138 TaxID=2709405 RepID=UPI0013EB1E70|nr:YfhO family protein [Adlercreutzia sp. ZJ138]
MTYSYLIPITALAIIFYSVCRSFNLTLSSKICSKELVTIVGFSLLGICIIYWKFFCGASFYGYNDIGSDTLNQYIPFYLDFIEDIRSGSLSFWDYNFGLGHSIFKSQSWVFDPFLCITVFFGLVFGDVAVPYALVMEQSLRIILCALLCDRFLAFYCKTPLARIIGSLIYAFNGFLLLWGQHYYLGNACIWVMLDALCIELCLRKQSYKHLVALAVSIAMTIICGIYQAFMVIMFLLIYSIIRSLYLNASSSTLVFFKFIYKPVLFALIGCFISCVVLIPSASSLLSDSTRITSGGTILDKVLIALTCINSPQGIFVFISRFMGNNLLGTGLNEYPILNFYETPQIGCTSLIFIFLALFIHWLFTQDNRKIQILCSIAILLVVLFVVDGFLPAMLNVFAAISYRGSFVIAVLAVLMISFVIENVIMVRKINLPTLLISYMLSGAILIACAWYAPEFSKLLCIIFFIMMTSCVVLFIVYQKYISSKKILLFSLLLVVSTSVVDGFCTVNARSTLNSETFPVTEFAGIDEDTDKALDYLDAKERNDSYYRIEKTYYDWTSWLDALDQHYDAISSYDSVISGGLQRYYENFWPSISVFPGNYIYTSVREDFNNPAAMSYLDVRYVLSREPLNYLWLEEIQRIGDVYIYKNINDVSLGRLYSSAITQEECGKLSVDERKHILDERIVVDPSESDSVEKFIDSTGATIENVNFTKHDDGTLTGVIDTDKTAILSIAIPYNKGWHVLVDGEEQEIYTVNYGFLGTTINSSGIHNVELYFVPDGLNVGAALSVFGILALVGSGVICRVRNNDAD